MASFDYPKHKQNNLKFTWQHIGVQISLGIKINLDPIVRWRRMVKNNVHRVYNL